MAATLEEETGSGWRKPAALLLGVAAVGLPLNDVVGYALLVVLAVVVFSGEVSASLRAWAAAVAIIVIATAGQFWLAPPRIDEGHNVFLPGGPTGALEKGLPPEVYKFMAAEFDKQYPPDKRCTSAVTNCWTAMEFPNRAYAFSADGIFHKSDMSRSVTGLDFTDPVWLRLGFINEFKYNWYIGSDVQRDLAIVVAGGLSLATFLTLFIIPTFYFVLERRAASQGNGRWSRVPRFRRRCAGR